MATRTLPTVVILTAALLISCRDASAQFVQQGGKLVGAGAVGKIVYQGCSVAISADGNTAAVWRL